MRRLKDLLNAVPAPDTNTATGRAVLRIGHEYEHISVASNLLAIGIRFVPNKPVRMALRYTNIAAATGAIMAAQAHRRALCENCAAAMPLNGPEAAARHAKELKALHFLMEHPVARPLYLATPLVTALVLRRTGRTGRIIDDVTQIGFDVTMGHLMRLHTRLQPWCPQCHWNDGGDKEPSPDPEPNLGLVH